MKLNLGCAKDVKEGYINVDLHYKHPDVVNDDICDLKFVKNNTVDKIIAKDIIEHLPLDVAIKCLKTWYDYLCFGGKMLLQTTNFDKIKDAYIEKVWDLHTLNHMLFAGTGYVDKGNMECDFHKSVYTTKFLRQVLEQIGYEVLGVQEDQIDETLKTNPRAHNLNVTFVLQKNKQY